MSSHRPWAWALASLLLPLAGCSEQEVVTQLRSLSASGSAVFVCRDDNGNGHPYSECPDLNASNDAHPSEHLSVFALVSQTVTDEVAVVNVSAGSVVDVEPSTPGFGFLRVAGRPVSMAPTPGGQVTFVATADVGRNGIFALPTMCLGAPAAGEKRRDLTTWPACRLPETPGEIAVVVQPNAAEDIGSCKATAYAGDATSSADCSADLSTEGGPSGRRKLLVSFPDTAEIAVIDAQDVLNIAPGTFENCPIETRLALKVDVPAGVTQRLPEDLQTDCSEVPAPSPPPPSARAPRPAGFAQSEDKLFVADQAAPVIHVLDTSSACELTELPSLLPMSLREPDRVVTTRRVAVSPLTPSGQRFVYAIDSEDQPGASVMAFDVSPGSTDPTPIVRPGSPELPWEKPDRLALGSSARDVAFAYRDIPYANPATGVAEFGDRCDPLTTDQNSPGWLARPSSDYTAGARPGLLRGLFAFILLTNGKIAVVDIDDFDAACRRPVTGNTGSTPDFRGCAGDSRDLYVADPSQPSLDVIDGKRAVTGEVSCRMTEPHRFRSARLMVSDSTYGAAPSLRSLPQLTLPASAASSRSENRPRLLAVNFTDASGQEVPTDVFVGSTRYSTDPSVGRLLPVDPNDQRSQPLESLNSVALPPLEPRSYSSNDTVTVTYEGSYAGDRPSGILDKRAHVLRDQSLAFCSGAGVYDVATMSNYAEQELGLSATDAKAFGERHADFVQLIDDFPADDDEYWTHVATTRAECEGKFGAADATPLSEDRDLRILSAFEDRLELDPVGVDWNMIKDCFPGALKYRLRARSQWVLLHSGAFRHDVVQGASGACVRSCSPLKKWNRGRVFEISSRPPHCIEGEVPTSQELDWRVGCATDDDVACVYDQGPEGESGHLSPSDPAAKCVFTGLNERFALYRGREASERDYVFTWQTTGGFSPLLMNLASSSSNVSPQSIQYLAKPEQLAVVDAASEGLSLFSLDTFGLVAPSPFY